MNIQTYLERFHLTMRADPEFMLQLKGIDERLDCAFNTLEACWMVIIWQKPTEWHWVMSCRDHETGQRYLPCSFVIDRIKELRTKWLGGTMIKEIEKFESEQERSRRSENESWAHELAKDLRRPLINDMDGVVSSWNIFL